LIVFTDTDIYGTSFLIILATNLPSHPKSSKLAIFALISRLVLAWFFGLENY